jgi:hypothetical protein
VLHQKDAHGAVVDRHRSLKRPAMAEHSFTFQLEAKALLF